MSTAVVLMAYGSPDRIADVPAYYADIRGARPIKQENLDALVAR
jgi:protoheme ferro-lyase